MPNVAPTRYHLSKSNKPAVCEADKRACPRGHYDTLLAAQTAAVENTLPVGTPEAHLLALRSAEVGVDPNRLRDADGRSLTMLWSERLAEADAGSGLEAPDEVISSLIGVDCGRVRGWGAEWRVPGEPIDNDDEAAEVGFAGDWDARLAAGEVPVMYVHTRNGGGNRECYCDDVDEDGHEPGCLEQVNEGMQAHELYLFDQDDSYDSTYANFYFRVPEGAHDRLRRAYADERQVRRIRTAEGTLRQMAGDRYEPSALWGFFEPNRATVVKQTELRAEVTVLREQQRAAFLEARTSRVDGGYLDAARAHDGVFLGKLERVADDVLAGEVVDAQRLREVGFSRAVGSINDLRENRAVIAAAAAEAAEREALLVKMRELDPALADAAAKHMNPAAEDAVRVQRARERVERIERPYRQLAGGLRKQRRAAEKITGLETRLRVLTAHVRFPGDPERLRLPQV